MLAIKSNALHFQYAGEMKILQEITLDIPAKEHWGIVGSSGCGKTTLLQHCAGLYPAAGHLWVSGIEATKENLTRIRTLSGYVFQNPEDQLFLPTVRDDLAFGPLNLKLPLTEVSNRVAEVASLLNLTALLDRPSQNLSGGEKRSVALGTVLTMKPGILLLDEPSNDLDAFSRRNLIRFLKEWEGTLLLATHDLELILEVTSKVAILQNGCIYKVGCPRMLFQQEELMTSIRLEIPYSLRKRATS